MTFDSLLLDKPGLFWPFYITWLRYKRNAFCSKIGTLSFEPGWLSLRLWEHWHIYRLVHRAAKFGVTKF